MTKLHILYTEEEGGDFKFIAKHSDEATRQFYEETVKTGYLIHSIGDKTIKVSPAYICLSEEIDGYDFVIKRRRIGTTLLDDKKEETSEATAQVPEKTEKEGEDVQ